MKLAAAAVDGFVKKPDPAIRCALVYGPDGGLARERALTLVRAVAETVDDPFRVVECSGAQLIKDPARLADEAAALSLTGGRRAVRIVEAGDKLAPLFQSFFATPAGDAFIVVEAGELPPKSALRKLFEKEKKAVAIPCYADEGENLARLIRDALAGHGLRATPDAQTYLSRNLGANRMVSRAELEKLALFMGAPGTVTLDDAATCVADVSGFSLDLVAFAAATGDKAGLDQALDRARREGIAPISILRGVARHFQRLHFVTGLIEQGQPPAAAMKKLWPPVFFKLERQFSAQTRHWRGAKLARALEILIEAELQCKVTVNPPEAVCGRALLQLATAARSR